MALLCNSEYYYIVDSGMYLNNTHRICCCVYTATVVTRTRHNVTSCSRTLPVLLFYLSSQLFSIGYRPTVCVINISEFFLFIFTTLVSLLLYTACLSLVMQREFLP
jgi:hypothetical protein